MRQLLMVSATLIVCAMPSVARAQDGNTSVQGFGGLTFGTSSVLGTSTASTFGGSIAAGLTPNIQIIGEVGRLSDIKPPLLDLLDFTPFDLRVSAWYGEAGVRFIASPHSNVRPYAEATAGMARLSTGLSGFGGRTDAVIDAGLSFLNRTEPLLGVGGGVVVQGGPIALDIGYRYKKIMATGDASALNARNDYQVNQVRIGLGIRF
jgi:opacity protein-like surface antigen